MLKTILRIYLHLRYFRRDFRVTDYAITPENVLPGHEIFIKGSIHNASKKRGTVYLLVIIAPAYDHDHPLFDSDRDLDTNAREALRIVRLLPQEQRPFAVRFRIPESAKPGVYDLRFELWTPARLYPEHKWPYLPYCFYRTDWDGLLNVVSHANETRARLTLFISYAAFSVEHKKWVMELVNELTRHDLHCLVDQLELTPGDDIETFMQRIADCDIFLPICSEEYTRKADAILGGVGKEVSIMMRHPKCSIPIVRDNPRRTLPSFLKDLWYADMDRQDWRGEPFTKLVSSVQRLRGT